MPLQQIITTWFAINGSDDVSPSGIASLRTGEPVFAGGLNVGDYFDTTEKEANDFSYVNADATKPLGVTVRLHAGRYRRVQLHPHATIANVGAGKIGFMVNPLYTDHIPNVNIVTSSDSAAQGLANVRPVVFLNKVTPGNYTFIQELGVANGVAGAALTAGLAVGVTAATGLLAASGTPTIGNALAAASANAFALFLINGVPVVQG